MPDKDPNHLSLITSMGFIAASLWGGVVAHILHIRKYKKPFVWREALMQVVVSGFSGVLTIFLCRYAGSPEMLTGFMVGTAGFMGSKALELFQQKFNKFVG
ncbi:phage holin family protein [Vibrio vulnificus]|uniref:phage holin family protein n=1 Tax=Vibrio vulnificus TaxID=672 RepID=UPI001A22369C|nr:phage holin family protein [Vibrio vulnificus]EGQ7854332.1 hypothetical protein [Vibrio vulnificus]EIE1227658.1 phage holin family protein [Vibrio vulnificus]MCJ0806665.1 phage holin family protein [Vibrio vulnificus]MDK2679239.1 phage holin family protein [Vibrio vulnificus]MDK2688032.1 phage holin family protein [Vibrio vulnificus]